MPKKIFMKYFSLGLDVIQKNFSMEKHLRNVVAKILYIEVVKFCFGSLRAISSGLQTVLHQKLENNKPIFTTAVLEKPFVFILI